MKPSASEYVCDASKTQNLLSVGRTEARFACYRNNAPSSSKVDGRLPDIDYTKMTMKNLDELNDRILMEFEHVFIRLKPGAGILLSRTTRNLEDSLTEEVFIDGLQLNPIQIGESSTGPPTKKTNLTSSST
ncbi:hypothetical protein AHF37_09200 [Paragonimus kellicotti]|nr:hypothetical protein AHF37_09200 [Paragonimus kellicotti]